MKKSKKGRILVISEAFSQIFIMIVSIFAFAFIIALGFGFITFEIPSVNAASYIPQGCCLEGKDGSICQNMNQIDADSMCKEGLIATDCQLVESCQSGCCYDSEEGICSLNSPKGKCELNGGNWTKDALCNIPQCQLGCCVIGDQASVTTPYQCTKISNELNFERNYQSLDSDGSCNTKIGLGNRGACVSPAQDFSGKNDCKFTEKSSCLGGNAQFYQGYLCTAPDLNTNCFPSKDTTCVEDKDQVYYLDTCGNIANIYDSNKWNDTSYWEAEIPVGSSSLCDISVEGSSTCGNCDYMNGNRCYAYREGKDIKPVYGNNVCRDLSCANGRKHGESWCISDYSNTDSPSVSPVGSRWFIGSCMDGEISITPCADFNQELCVENNLIGDNNSTFSEAKCTVNGWRSCIAANEKEGYYSVEQECDKYPNDCIMFNDIPGNDKYKNSQGEWLPGFKEDLPNSEQGAAGDVGKNANTVIPFCVPKYTAGMVFWQTEDNTKNSQSSKTTSTQKSYTGLENGGSLEETSAICSLGSFTCVSHKKKSGQVNSWEFRENPECDIGYNNGEDTEMILEALSERCRMLGPCGIYVNINGELGSNEFDNSTLSRTKISATGHESSQSIAGYSPSKEYFSSLSGKAGIIKAGSLNSLTLAVVAVITGTVFKNNGITGKATEQVNQEAQTGVATSAAEQQQTGNLFATASGGLGALAMYAGAHMAATMTLTVAPNAAASYIFGNTITVYSGGAAGLTTSVPAGGELVASSGEASLSAGTLTPAGAALSIVGYTLAAAAAGYMIGQLIGKWAHMTPGQTEALSYSLATGFGGIAASYMIASAMATYGTAGGTTVFAGIGTIVGAGSAGSSGGLSSAAWFGIWGIVVAIILAVVTYLFTGVDNEYYIMNYKCDIWTPPKKGDCNLCNNDIRTCSEYRCRSLGLNCHYYNENGEPGYCAAIEETWSAKITPWQEALSEGNKYTEVKTMSFKIESNNTENNGKVEAWTPLQFGIITDDRATCRLDTKHTSSYEEMKYDFAVDNLFGCASGSCGSQGKYHKIVLSPHIQKNESDSQTPGMQEGDNNYYIRCKNFAGQTNDAEFAVKVVVGKGPDYTPPLINSFVPESESYLKQGQNSSSVTVYVNEPSDCKYSQNVNNLYKDMTQNLTCVNDPSLVFLNNWPCFATLNNLNTGENKFYFKCQDQPELGERSSEKRNINENAKEYILNVCSVGLSITKLEPQNQIITGKSPVSLTLKAETSGCVENGKSVCYYKFEDYNSSSYIAFLNTHSNTHSQEFTSMPSGEHVINVRCEDEAGNTANSSLNVNVYLDNDYPLVTRTYDINNMLNVITNENSNCLFTNNNTIGCSYTLDDNGLIKMDGSGTIHTTAFISNKDYYIKCYDAFGNANPNCGIILRTY